MLSSCVTRYPALSILSPRCGQKRGKTQKRCSQTYSKQLQKRERVEKKRKKENEKKTRKTVSACGACGVCLNALSGSASPFFLARGDVEHTVASFGSQASPARTLPPAERAAQCDQCQPYFIRSVKGHDALARHLLRNRRLQEAWFSRS